MLPALDLPSSPFLDPPALGTPRVLIVDEAEPVVRALRDILLRLGIPRADVAHAGSPEEALAFFQRGIFAHLEKPIRMEKVRQVLQDAATEEGNVYRIR